MRLLALLICFNVGYAEADSSLESVSFLLGCWEKKDGGTSTLESWAQKSSAVFTGSGKELQNGKTVFWEKLRIEVLGADIIYAPSPMGKPTVTFKYKKTSVRKGREVAIFENMKHDFPQTIMYLVKRSDPDQLYISLKGVGTKSKPISREYTLKRKKCQE